MSQKQSNLPFYTLSGCGALAIWTITAVIVSELDNLPLFLTVFIAFATSFLCVAVQLSIKQNWKMILKQPFYVWFIGVAGICGSDLAYVKAIKHAPPAHVDLIDYLWPFLVILFSSFMPKEKFHLKYLMAGFLGLLGIYILLFQNQYNTQFNPNYLQGYLYALLGALCWSVYTIFTKYLAENVPTEMVGIYCGVGAIICLILHLLYETPVVPKQKELVLGIILGLSSSGLAYVLWDLGCKKGNLKLLSVLTYFTPIVSMGLLVYFDKEPLTVNLLIACSLVILGVIVGSLNWKESIRFIKSIKFLNLYKNLFRIHDL
ncbi:MAG: EamA family transporter [Francisellaceae bacterium]|nr:EamA family transporter [Francisellaceae bacterium]